MDRIDALEALVRLAELGTFSAVATDMRIRQSTVSKWVAALEEELGTQLVERTTRRLRFTEHGSAFLEDARQILDAYQHAAGKLGAKAPVLKGLLRVSVPVVFGGLYVVPELRRFMAAYPEIDLELVFSDRYVNLLEEGVDVAIRVGTPEDSSYRSHVLGETKRHLVASPKFVETHGPFRRPDSLRGVSCLMHSGLTRGDTWTLHRGGESTRVPVQGRFAANNSEALLAMAKAGVGVAMLATWLVEKDIAAGRLVELLPKFDLPRAPIRALTAPTRFPHRRVAAFIDHLRERFLPRWG